MHGDQRHIRIAPDAILYAPTYERNWRETIPLVVEDKCGIPEEIIAVHLYGFWQFYIGKCTEFPWGTPVWVDEKYVTVLDKRLLPIYGRAFR